MYTLEVLGHHFYRLVYEPRLFYSKFIIIIKKEPPFFHGGNNVQGIYLCIRVYVSLYRRTRKFDTAENGGGDELK